MKLRVCLPLFATLAFTITADAQRFTTKSSNASDSSPLKIRYFANLSIADSYIDMSNDGSDVTSVNATSAFVEGTAVAGATASTQNICANVYTFDADEEMVSCCTCPITAHGLKSLSVKNDLVSNTLTPGVPLAVIVELVATTPVINFGSGGPTLTNGCDATQVPYPLNANSQTAEVTSLHAWGTTPHLNTANALYLFTETAFDNADLENTEAFIITRTCGFISSIGSGFGICKSCLVRGLGTTQQ